MPRWARLIAVVEPDPTQSQSRGNALINGEWPWAIDDMRYQVGVCAELAAIASLELR